MKNLNCNYTLIIFGDHSPYGSGIMTYSIFLPSAQWNKSSLIVGKTRDGGNEFKKVQCPVCDESHDLDNRSM